MPGGFDPNTYFDYHFDEENKSADDFYLGTKAAISGGTTTILSVVSPKKGESIMDAIYEARRSYDAKVCCDYSLIVKVDNWTKNVKDEMKMLSEKHGISKLIDFQEFPRKLSIFFIYFRCLLIPKLVGH